MISQKLLKELYKTMVRIRLSEESFVQPILRGEIRCPVHLYTGQEAIAAGVCAVLKKGDYIFGNHRSHGHYLGKGGNLKELVAEVYCADTGCSRGRGGSMHLIAPDRGLLGTVPIVGGTISLAVGAALATKLRGEKRVTVSFFGDGAAGEGVLYEAMNFASLRKLPIIFACENNFYSTHMPIRECRSQSNIFKLSELYCIPGYRVDGNDILKVYEIAREAVEMCRVGQGPVFLEFLTYRIRGHVGPDDNVQGFHKDIRPAEEITKWKKRDPIRKLKRHILAKGFMRKQDLERIHRRVEREVERAHLFARRSNSPRKSRLTFYVFKDSKAFL
jgi:TPP-dependent pyruvate/acetoin dehydrogenase alpha subunit